MYKRFKIDVLGISQGRHPTDVFSGRFDNICRTFIQNFNNKQQLTFKYFTQRIWWVGSKIIQQWCVLYYVWNWRPEDVPRTSLRRRHFRNIEDFPKYRRISKIFHCWIPKRQKHWHLRRWDIASCTLTKQTHLGKCSNGILATFCFDMWFIFEHVLRYFIIDNNYKVS